MVGRIGCFLVSEEVSADLLLEIGCYLASGLTCRVGHEWTAISGACELGLPVDLFWGFRLGYIDGFGF